MISIKANTSRRVSSSGGVAHIFRSVLANKSTKSEAGKISARANTVSKVASTKIGSSGGNSEDLCIAYAIVLG